MRKQQGIVNSELEMKQTLASVEHEMVIVTILPF